MKKLFVAIVMMCALAVAQTSSGTASDTPKASKKAAKSDNKEKTVKGCLHKDGDNWWLQTRMGKYHVMSKDDISAHDGHEVKVTGGASTGPLPGDTSGKQVKHLEASKVEMVSDKCAMGTKSVKLSDNEMNKSGRKKK